MNQLFNGTTNIRILCVVLNLVVINSRPESEFRSASMECVIEIFEGLTQIGLRIKLEPSLKSLATV